MSQSANSGRLPESHLHLIASARVKQPVNGRPAPPRSAGKGAMPRGPPPPPFRPPIHDVDSPGSMNTAFNDPSPMYNPAYVMMDSPNAPLPPPPRDGTIFLNSTSPFVAPPAAQVAHPAFSCVNLVQKYMCAVLQNVLVSIPPYPPNQHHVLVQVPSPPPRPPGGP